MVDSGALRSFVLAVMEDPSQDALLPFAIAAALNVCVDYSEFVWPSLLGVGWVLTRCSTCSRICF